MTSPSKKYAVAIDVSPSEQISGKPENVLSMGMLFALRSPNSFDLVGRDFVDDPLKLKKWSQGTKTYRERFVRHAHNVVANAQIICGVNRASEAHIAAHGKIVFEQLSGPIPGPSSHNHKGKPRTLVEGYNVDGVAVPPFEVLQDDLFVLGWLTESLASCLALLDKINDEPVILDVLSDRLPNEQGGEEYYKATLFKLLLEKATNKRAIVIGVPDPKMETQRELFVDNLAGLARELHDKPNGNLAKLIRIESLKVFSIDRITV